MGDVIHFVQKVQAYTISIHTNTRQTDVDETTKKASSFPQRATREIILC